MHVCWGNYVTLFSINFNWDCNQNNFKLLSCFWIVRYIGRRYWWRYWHGAWGGGEGWKREGALNKGLYPKFQPLTLLDPFLQAKHAFVPPPPFPQSRQTMSLKRNNIMCLKFILICQSHCHRVMKAQRIYFDYITWTCTGKYYIIMRSFPFSSFPKACRGQQ